MKLTHALFAAAFCTVAASSIQAQQLDWGNVVLNPITTSNGDPIDETFVFELGSFFNGFTPDPTNTDSWLANWKVFDQAGYDPVFGYSSATVYIENDVTSSNPLASTLSFAGLYAYIWVRKGDDPVEGSEWLLTRAENWKFPLVGGDCCDKTLIEWSVSDLDTETPEWGRQNGVTGPGEFTSTGTAGLQTFTFIPEPSSALLATMAGLITVLRRRRTAA